MCSILLSLAKIGNYRIPIQFDSIYLTYAILHKIFNFNSISILIFAILNCTAFNWAINLICFTLLFLQKSFVLGKFNNSIFNVELFPDHFSSQALPMVTLIVGKCNNTESTARITTCCNGADEPTSISFDLNKLCVGKPK